MRGKISPPPPTFSAPTYDARTIQVWQVVYPDFRRDDGYSSALFSTEQSAVLFAKHYNGRAQVHPQWVTMVEFMRLRKRHMV